MSEILRNYKFAVELIISDFDVIENRILDILKLCEEKHGSLIFEIQDIEATGTVGSRLTEQFSIKNAYKDLSDDFFNVLVQGDHVLELNLLIYRNKFSAWLIVRRGKDVNFLANDKSLLDEEKIGAYRRLDVSLFS
jgi:hypothetical protein